MQNSRILCINHLYCSKFYSNIFLSWHIFCYIRHFTVDIKLKSQIRNASGKMMSDILRICDFQDLNKQNYVDLSLDLFAIHSQMLRRFGLKSWVETRQEGKKGNIIGQKALIFYDIICSLIVIINRWYNFISIRFSIEL